MPRLPDYTALPQVQPSPSKHVPSYSPERFTTDALGQALQHIGSELQGFGADQKRKADTLQNAQADADFQTKYTGIGSDLSKDPDYEAAPQKYKEQTSAALQESASRIGDPQQRELFTARHQSSIARGTAHFEEQNWRKRRDAVVGEATGKLDELLKDGLSSGDDKIRSDNIGTGQRLIGGLAEAGYLTRGQAEKMGRQWAEKYGEAWVEGQPADKALEHLRTLVPKQGGALSPEQQAAARRTVNAAKPNATWGDPRDPNFEREHLTTITTAGGQELKVNKFAAPAFQGFLNDLEARGYKIDDIGGYALRNKRGGNTLSQHAFGNALDINPGANPMQGTLKTDLPGDVGELAAKWGLSWGGNWQGKKDAMHFEFTGIGGSAAQAREYGDKLPYEVSGFLSGIALSRAKATGVYEALPEPLQQKMAAGGRYTITREDADSIPDETWGKIAPQLGLPAPAERKAEAPARTGTPADFISGQRLPMVLRRTETRARVEANRRDSENAAEKYRMTKSLDEAVTRVLSGDSSAADAIDPDAVTRRLGPKALEEYNARLGVAYEVYKEASGLPGMTAADIELKLAQLTPDPAKPNMLQQEQVYASVKKRADALAKMREVDPAESVKDDPSVAKAATIAAGYPDKQGLLFDARMAAQQRAGISDPSPITRREASELAQPLDHILPGQERAALNKVAETAKQKYGDYADEAFAYALRTKKLSADAARIAGWVLRSLMRDQQPAPEDTKALDQQSELDAAKRAVEGGAQPGAFGMRRGANPGRIMAKDLMATPPTPYEQPAEQNLPPSKAVQALRADPGLTEQFDAKYGTGAAKRILEAYPVR